MDRSIFYMKLLLVEPDFPIPDKSKNHKDFLPIGLLKIACYNKSLKNKVVILRGNLNKNKLKKKLPFNKPDEIWVTSLFTYWSKYVRDSVQHYKALFPKAKVIVGGVYATLMPVHCKTYTGCDEVRKGTIDAVENFTATHKLDYSLLELENEEPLDYQIVHASRGCFRKCSFCGVWKVEPVITNKKTIIDEISKPKAVFYDNQMFANPNFKDLLIDLAKMKHN